MRSSWAVAVVLALTPACGERCLGSSSTTGDPGGDGCADERVLVVSKLATCDPEARWPDKVRVASWNMHAALAAPLDQVAQVLAELDADVVLLQEVDVGVQRSGRVDQPRLLAEQLGYAYVFAEALPWQGGQYGLAMLSRLPISSALRVSLDAAGALERRIGLDTTLCYGPAEVHVVGIHADVKADAGEQNVRDLVDALRGDLGSGVLIGGDFNATPDSAGPRALVAAGLSDVVGARDPSPTLSDRRIDYIFADARMTSRVLGARVVPTDRSDHRPVVLELAGDLSEGR